jgi:hypothetical protein
VPRRELGINYAHRVGLRANVFGGNSVLMSLGFFFKYLHRVGGHDLAKFDTIDEVLYGGKTKISVCYAYTREY